MDGFATISIAEGSAGIILDGLEQQVQPGMGLPVGAIICTHAGAHAEVVFADGTVVSMGEHSNLAVQGISFNPGQPTLWHLNLHSDQGTFRIVSGSIASNHGGGIQFSSDTAGIQMDNYGGDIIVRNGLTQVGSSMTDTPHLLITTALGTASIDTSGNILDILGGGILGEAREYTNFERAYFKSAAPLSADAPDEPGSTGQAHDEIDAHETSSSDFQFGSFGDVDHHDSDFGNADHHGGNLGGVDGQSLLTLFEAYFGENGTSHGLAVSLFENMGDHLPSSGLDGEALTTTIASSLAWSPLSDTGDAQPSTHGEHTYSWLSSLQEHFEDQHHELASLFSRWFGGGSDGETTQMVNDDTPGNGYEQSHVTDTTLYDGPDVLAQTDYSQDGSSTTDSTLSSGEESLPASSNHEAADSTLKNSFHASNPVYLHFNVNTDGLFGGSGSDDLTHSDDTPTTPNYDDWNASAVSSESTTNDTTISVPHYSLGIDYIRVHIGWFTISVPVPVITVNYSQQLISSEATTVTQYDDGATETQTMLDSDADGHWNQSTSTLLYADGAQRSVSLFDTNDDGHWDAYETSLVYNNGTQAATDSGHYADAPDDLLAHLALAADDPHDA